MVVNWFKFLMDYSEGKFYSEFVKYYKHLRYKHRKISRNKAAYYFALKKFGYSTTAKYAVCIRAYGSYDGWIKETIRIAKTPWLD